MYLIDTNVFWEILLNQEKTETCKIFLDTNRDNLYVSDFSLHSIGVILFKNNKASIFKKFVEDVLEKIKLTTIQKESDHDLPEIKKSYELDFDDAYQYNVVKDHDLEIVTMDSDFEKVQHDIKVNFL